MSASKPVFIYGVVGVVLGFMYVVELLTARAWDNRPDVPAAEREGAWRVVRYMRIAAVTYAAGLPIVLGIWVAMLLRR